MSDDDERSADEIIEDSYLSEAEIAAQWVGYIGALEAEMEMAQEVAVGTATGEITADRMVEALPDPTPMEAWHNDRWTSVSSDPDWSPRPTLDDQDNGE